MGLFSWVDEQLGISETFNEVVEGAGELVSDVTETVVNSAAYVADQVIHTTAVVVDGFEEGVASIGGLVVGGVGDVANWGVRTVSGGEWELYEGGFGTGIQNVQNGIATGIDNAQAIMIDAPANFVLDQLGVDYEVQFATPPLRNDFDRALFGASKAVGQTVAGAAVVVAGGAVIVAAGAGSLAAGTAAGTALAAQTVTGVGGVITLGATAYGAHTNIEDQFAQADAEEELLGRMVTARFDLDSAGEPEPAEPVVVMAEVEQRMVSAIERALGAPAPGYAYA